MVWAAVASAQVTDIITQFNASVNIDYTAALTPDALMVGPEPLLSLAKAQTAS